MRFFDLRWVVAVGVLFATPVSAQDSAQPVKTIDRDPYSDIFFKTLPLRPLTLSGTGGRNYTTDQKATIGGRTLKYRTTLAEVILRDAGGRPMASVFSTSYVSQWRGEATRPVLFAFNGGPGGSSSIANFVFGPLRLKSEAPEKLHDPDNGVEANPLSLLDVADLVFIDPVETGYSKVLPGIEDHPFFTLDGDAEQVTAVILQWLRDHQRLGSPVYIFGESYGSLRAVAVARDLARSEPAVVARGVILAGTSLTLSGWGRASNPMLLANRVPMMASVAHYHGMIDNTGQTWDQAVERARKFAYQDYLPALMKGTSLTHEEFDRTISALPGIIGVPEQHFRAGGKITVSDFNRELLKHQNRVLDSNNGLFTHAKDYVSPRTYEAFSAAYERNIASRLGAKGLGKYLAINPNLFSRWESKMSGAPTMDVTLRQLVDQHPNLRVLVMQGRYDTLTDLGTTEFMMAQSQVPQDRYKIAYYDGGHSIIPVPEAIEPIRELLSR
ncbi:hypothetical protein [Sphingosinicella sp.]|uniref:S10 family serine carboxypeptidase-like protein n=1 Tax=Sphingosinicella sp. TaxID=1917971 RepID=UPI0035ADCCC4